MTAKRKNSANPANKTQQPTPEPLPLQASSASHVVASIFPAREIHLFGGASHSGKTTLVLHQFIARWRRGLPVFGHESFPSPFCYIVCDRPLSALESSLARTGNATAEQFPALSLVDSLPPDPNLRLFDQALVLARKRVPDLKVLFMDGIHRVCPGRANELRDVSDFMALATRRLQEEDITLIGIGHAAKVKGDERFSNPRERFLGSSAWGASSSTMVIVERDAGDDIRDPKRTVMIMPLNAPDQILHYNLDAKGLFGLADIDDPDRYDDFAMLVSLQDADTEMASPFFMDIAMSFGAFAPSKSTVDRYVQRLVDEGVLEKFKWGKYRISVKQ